MAEVLVLVEHTDGQVKKATLELLRLARRLGDPAAVFVGDGFEAAQPVLAEHGAATVYVTEDAAISRFLMAPTAELLAQLVESSSPVAVLLTSSADGKKVAARLAIKTKSG